MDHDYAKRGFLLPEGCNDLVDVFKFQNPESCAVLLDVRARSTHCELMPQILGELAIREPITVQELAALVGQHPSRVIGDLLDISIYSSVATEVRFGAASKVARRYGFKAKHLATNRGTA